MSRTPGGDLAVLVQGRPAASTAGVNREGAARPIAGDVAEPDLLEHIVDRRRRHVVTAQSSEHGGSCRTVITAAALRPGLDIADAIAATRTATRGLARRVIDLDREIRAADVDVQVLLRQAAPRLLELPGVGSEVAAQLLITAGDNPERIPDERAFAALCGVSRIPASSGRTGRHRLNRGGDRQANRALYIVAVNRMRCHPQTLAYVQRRREQGLSNNDI
ncbi:transposase [Micromonospora chersina]|uniref:transposase n=1 Tax=Micromonospora chersina TaxID=47854 RepID=UPI0037AAE293